MAEFLNRWRVRRAQDAFEAQLEPHVDHLYRLAMRFTKSPHASEDLVQDVLIKVYRMRKQFTDIEQPRAWLARVLYREYVDRWRREKKAPLNFSSMEQHADDGEAFVQGIEDDQAVDPQAEVSNYELQEALTKAIASLNEDQQAVIMFHDVEGYTLEEISVVLGQPVGTLKSRIHRARARLREILSEMDGTFSSVESFYGSR